MSDTLLVVRPSSSQYKKMLKTTPVFLLVFAGLGVLRLGLAGLALLVIMVAVVAAFMWWYMRRAHLVVTHNELVRVGPVGRQSWPRTEIGTVVSAPMPASVMDSRAFLNLFLLDRNGRKILRLKNTHWDDADLNRLTEALGLPVEGFRETVTARQFAQRYPGVLPFVERRPWLTALMVFVVVFFLAVILVLITG